MKDNEQPQTPYIRRVLNNDSTRRGIAAAAAGVIIGCVVEALWPSTIS